jgi:arylsulfatase A-like enzyme
MTTDVLRRSDVCRSLAAALAILLVPGVGAASQRDAPNFVFILTDDQGWAGTSISMDPKRPNAKSDCYRTPRLERLAKGGMRFTQGYAPAAVCCPTRRSIQFGQTPARMGNDKAFAKHGT